MFKNSFLSSFSNKVRSSTLISIFRKRIDGKGKFERENEDERMLRTICSYYSLPLERLLNGASLHSEATLELNAKISRKRRGMNSRNIKPRRVLYLRFRKTISKRRYIRDLSRENRETGRYVTYSLCAADPFPRATLIISRCSEREREGCYRICNYVSCQPRLVSLNS